MLLAGHAVHAVHLPLLLATLNHHVPRSVVSPYCTTKWGTQCTRPMHKAQTNAQDDQQDNALSFPIGHVCLHSAERSASKAHVDRRQQSELSALRLSLASYPSQPSPL